MKVINLEANDSVYLLSIDKNAIDKGMRKVVVDTNILFAALRVKSSAIRNILVSSDITFYSPNFLMTELFKHKERILNKSKLTEEETYETLTKLFTSIHFVSEDSLSTGNLIAAYRLCNEIDEKDTPFVALALELECEIWTNDEVLKSGLKKRGFHSFFTPKKQ